MTKSRINCKKLSFEECELAILRMSVDKAQEKIQKREILSKDISRLMKVVETFIEKKELICYGGTAINNILPVEDQFYNKNIEIPDYDFFSSNAVNDAKELADKYLSEGYTEIEAKAGQHYGTYKVFVNYIPVADITQMSTEIMKPLKRDSIKINGIYYASPNFLRMSMFLELSRPAGDTGRWEKVLKRNALLNKHYPLYNNCGKASSLQRKLIKFKGVKADDIYKQLKMVLIKLNVVFFGGFAISLYSQHLSQELRGKLNNYADFDVLTNEVDKTSTIISERLKDMHIGKIRIKRHAPVGEIIPKHNEIMVDTDTVCFVYNTIGCNSYNVITHDKQTVKIASIDTMLSLYLAFLYTNRPYYNQFIDRILCMCQLLFDVQKKNRLKQDGILKRFSITCKGHQKSVGEMRTAKSEKYLEFKGKERTKDYDLWFLNYKPVKVENKISKTKTEIKTRTKKQKSKTKTKTKKQKLKNKNKNKNKRSTRKGTKKRNL